MDSIVEVPEPRILSVHGEGEVMKRARYRSMLCRRCDMCLHCDIYLVHSEHELIVEAFLKLFRVTNWWVCEQYEKHSSSYLFIGNIASWQLFSVEAQSPAWSR